jgi:hypothetical protein
MNTARQLQGDWVRVWFLSVAMSACLSFLFPRSILAEQRLNGTVGSDGKIHVGRIVSSRQIRLFLALESEWKSKLFEVADGILVPGAPFELSVGTNLEPNLVTITTIANNGRIVTLKGTRDNSGFLQVDALSLSDPSQTFPPGCDFATVENGTRRMMFAISDSGALIEIDRVTRQLTVVENRRDVVLPGGNIETLDGDTNAIFLIDRRGNLVSYVRDPIRVWKGPQLIGTGFLAGSDVIVWRRPDGGRETYVAAVNALGELRFAKQEANGWRMEIAPGWVLPPGSPLGVFHTPSNLRLFAVNANGTFLSMHLVNTEWRERIIGDGYRKKTVGYLPPQTLMVLSVDAAGDLLTSTSNNDVWTSFLTPEDGSSQSGTILKREWSNSTDITTEFRFWNRSDSEVNLRFRDNRFPLIVHDHQLAANDRLTLKLNLPTARTLTTWLKPPSAVGAETKTFEFQRTTEIPCQNPYDFEILKQATGLSYQDERLHRFPPVRVLDRAEISLGTFRLTENVSSKTVNIDAIESAIQQKIVPID